VPICSTGSLLSDSREVIGTALDRVL